MKYPKKRDARSHCCSVDGSMKLVDLHPCKAIHSTTTTKKFFSKTKSNQSTQASRNHHTHTVRTKKGLIVKLLN